MIDAVIFDMDGLMFDTERLCIRAWDAAGVELGLGPLGHMNALTLGQSRDATRQVFLERFGPGFDYDNFRQVAAKHRSAIIAAEGFPEKPGLRLLLDGLETRCIRKAVCTSSTRQTAWRNLALSGLAGRFCGVSAGDMVARAKPAPGLYLHACRQLGLPPRRCLALEDSPNGVRAAAAAGLSVIMVPDLVQPDAEIRGLTRQVLPHLAAVLPLV